VSVAEAPRAVGTFQVLWCWLEGDTYIDRPGEELNPRQVDALRDSVAGRRHGFALVVRRNWRAEQQTRNLELRDDRLRDLWKLPDGAAVDRLLGYQDADRWRPGIAPLEPAQAKVLRLSVIDRLPTWVMCRELHMTPGAVKKARSEGRRKLRELLGLPARERRWMVITPAIEGLVAECVAHGESVIETLEVVAAHARRHGNALTYGDALEIARRVQQKED
jgi:hypothetical protein